MPERTARRARHRRRNSAAQAALAAYRAGHQVVMRSRRPLTTFHSISESSSSTCTADRMRFEFLCLPMKARGMAVRAATPGGSVPGNYLEELRSIHKPRALCGSRLTARSTAVWFPQP